LLNREQPLARNYVKSLKVALHDSTLISNNRNDTSRFLDSGAGHWSLPAGALVARAQEQPNSEHRKQQLVGTLGLPYLT